MKRLSSWLSTVFWNGENVVTETEYAAATAGGMKWKRLVARDLSVEQKWPQDCTGVRLTIDIW